MQKFVALWELLTDVEQGLIDSPEASARADAVAAGFGGRLVLQVAQGRFQPSHGWPLRDVATVVASLRDRLEKKTAPITPLPGPAAPLLRPVASRAPANRMVDLAPLEMVQSKVAVVFRARSRSARRQLLQNLVAAPWHTSLA